MTTDEREQAWKELERWGWDVYSDSVEWRLWIPGYGYSYGYRARDEAIDYALKLA